MKRAVAGLLALGVTTALAACSSDSDTTPGTDLEDTRYEDAVAATNALGLDLMLAQGADANAIVSPVSVTIALAMLGEGTEGAAEEELADLLGLPHEHRSAAYGALSEALGAYESGDFSVDDLPDDPFVRVANNVVVHEGFEVLTSFTDAVTSHFGATTDSTDLTSQVGKDVLDAWVNEQTEGLIEESAIEPNEDLRLVLQNALLFAAQWDEPFGGGATMDADFTRGDGSPTRVEMMSKRSEIAYGEAGGHQAIALPYTSDFVAYVVLPPEGAEPTADGINSAIGALQEPADTQIAIPKFDLAADADVREFLEDRGVSALFEDETGLRGIADADLVVGAIAQQGRLIVDEEGTIGAAVTEVAVGVTSAPMQTFTANRPFVFIVQHEETGVDLFTAHIGDPTAG